MSQKSEYVLHITPNRSVVELVVVVIIQNPDAAEAAGRGLVV